MKARRRCILRTRALVGVAAGLAMAVCGTTAATAAWRDDLREALQELRYDEARDLLQRQLEATSGEERAEVFLQLAAVSTQHAEVRRFLREARRYADTEAMRQRADRALARLDYARGNYNSVRTRLRDDDGREARLLVARALVALDRPHQAREQLQGLPADPEVLLLRSWTARQSGDPREALLLLEQLAREEGVDAMPTVLLWKTECEAELGLREAALSTAATLQRVYPLAPETILLEPTLAALRRAEHQARDAGAARVVLQLGAFQDRANALRFRDGLPADVRPVQVVEIRRGARRIFRVQVGPFDTRAIAEAFARQHLDPQDLDWRVARPETP